MATGTNDGRGPAGPPRKRVTAMADWVAMFMYSARKNMAKRMPVYSVWNPPTSSCSASTRSKGARFVSATAAMQKMKKGIGAGGGDQVRGVPLRGGPPGPAIARGGGGPAGGA